MPHCAAHVHRSVACKWFLNLYVDTLPLESLIAAWDLLMTGPSASAPLDTASGHADPATLAATLVGGTAAAAELRPRVELLSTVEPPPSLPPSPDVAQPAASSYSSSALLRVALGLLTLYAPRISLHLTDELLREIDATTAYAALLQMGPELQPDQLRSVTGTLPLSSVRVAELRGAATQELEAIDLSSTTGGAGATPCVGAPLEGDRPLAVRIDELMQVWVVRGGSDGSDGVVMAVMV